MDSHNSGGTTLVLKIYNLSDMTIAQRFDSPEWKQDSGCIVINNGRSSFCGPLLDLRPLQRCSTNTY